MQLLQESKPHKLAELGLKDADLLQVWAFALMNQLNVNKAATHHLGTAHSTILAPL